MTDVYWQRGCDEHSISTRAKLVNRESVFVQSTFPNETKLFSLGEADLQKCGACNSFAHCFVVSFRKQTGKEIEGSQSALCGNCLTAIGSHLREITRLIKEDIWKDYVQQQETKEES